MTDEQILDAIRNYLLEHMFGMGEFANSGGLRNAHRVFEDDDRPI